MKITFFFSVLLFSSSIAQPPGVPEICKKSLTTAPCTGGMELFIIGKNFLKDTRVKFQKEDEECHWEEVVYPDKEYLQQVNIRNCNAITKIFS